MFRNEKTGRFESESKREMTEEQREAICYRSKVLNKYFDTYEDLQAAEAEYNEKHAAELKAKEERKAAAEVVKEAIKERIKAEFAAKQAKAEAYKTYLAACDTADEDVRKKREAESNSLKSFNTKYGRFHDSIEVDGVTYSVDYSTSSSTYVDPFERLLRWF